MPAVQTSDQIKVEDLSKALLLSHAKQTPLLTKMRKGEKLKDVIYSWSAAKEDESREGGIPENQDVDGFEGDNANKLYNRSQRFWRTPRVTVEAEKLAGLAVGDQAKYNGQLTKKIRAQKRDIEKNLLSYQESKEDEGIPGEGRGRKFKGLGRVINAGELAFTDTPMAIPAAWSTPTAQVYTGALTDFETADLSAMLQSRFDNQGLSGELLMLCGSQLKTWISENFTFYRPNKDGYTVIARTETSQTRKYVMGAIDLIESEYGLVEIALSSYIGAADGKPTSAPDTKWGYLLDMEGLHTRPLMYCDHNQLPYQGGGISGLIDSILGYEFGNPQSHMAIKAT